MQSLDSLTLANTSLRLASASSKKHPESALIAPSCRSLSEDCILPAEIQGKEEKKKFNQDTKRDVKEARGGRDEGGGETTLNPVSGEEQGEKTDRTGIFLVILFDSSSAVKVKIMK